MVASAGRITRDRIARSGASDLMQRLARSPDRPERLVRPKQFGTFPGTLILVFAVDAVGKKPPQYAGTLDSLWFGVKDDARNACRSGRGWADAFATGSTCAAPTGGDFNVWPSNCRNGNLDPVTCRPFLVRNRKVAEGSTRSRTTQGPDVFLRAPEGLTG